MVATRRFLAEGEHRLFVNRQRAGHHESRPLVGGAGHHGTARWPTALAASDQEEESNLCVALLGGRKQMQLYLMVL